MLINLTCRSSSVSSGDKLIIPAKLCSIRLGGMRRMISNAAATRFFDAIYKKKNRPFKELALE